MNDIIDNICNRANFIIWKKGTKLLSASNNFTIIFIDCYYICAFDEYLITFEYDTKLLSGLWKCGGPVFLENKPYNIAILLAPIDNNTTPTIVYRAALFTINNEGNNKIKIPIAEYTNMQLHIHDRFY